MPGPPPSCFETAAGCAGFRAQNDPDQTTYILASGGEIKITIIVLVALLVLGLWAAYATHDCDR